MSAPEPGSEALFAALDVGAVEMLKLLHPDAVDVDEESGDPVPVAAATKVKIFAAVTDYAALRAKAEPPKLKESKFHGLRERFNGESNPPAGRARKPRAARTEPSGDTE